MYIRSGRKQISNSVTAVGQFVELFTNHVINGFFKDSKIRGIVEYVLLEAMNNAWEHGNKKEVNGKAIVIDWKTEGEILEVSIKDYGEGFKPHVPLIPPPINIPRGRGLFSIGEFAHSMCFNDKGNKITFTFKKGGKMSTEGCIKEFHGNVVVFIPTVRDNIKEALDELRNRIIDHTAGSGVYKMLPMHLVIDLSPFNVVSSTLLGTFGATIQEEHVHSVILCGMKPAVLETAKRLGFIRDGERHSSSSEIENNIGKIKIFTSTKEGISSLLPQ